MKVTELFEARESTDKGYYTPGYREDEKMVVGTVKDWLARLKVTPEHMKEAIAAAKKLPSYEAVVALVPDVSTAAEQKNGTFSFKRTSKHVDDPKYHVYANGLIRQSAVSMWGDRRPTRMASPKPHIVAGDPVKSLIAIYNTAFKALAEKAAKAKKAD